MTEERHFPFKSYSNGLTVPRLLWCIECNRPAHQQFWRALDVPCETCGDHEATMCPQTGCFTYYDPYTESDYSIEELLRHSDPTRRKT